MTMPMNPNDEIRKLRDCINASVRIRNNTYQKTDGSWDRLWAAMDALEDAQIAIDDFRKLETVSYLHLYGLLQAFVVQQDSINLIRQTVISADPINWKNGEEPDLNKIRKLRNEAVGHPADIRTPNGTVYCNIDRHSLSKTGFEYLIWDADGAHNNKVDISDTIKTQSQEITRIITEMMNKISEDDKEFMKQFKDEKLIDKFNQISHYQFEKMYLHKNDPSFAQSMFSSLERIYSQLKGDLEKRYGSFDTTINAPGLKMIVDELDQLIDRIKVKFEEGIPDEFDFTVYVEILEAKWKEFGDMVKEADERFTSSD